MKNRFFRWIRFFTAIERAPQRRTSRTRLRLEALEDRLAPTIVNWIGGSGDWNTAANWLDATTLTNHVPVAGDDAVVNVAGVSVTHSTGTHTVNSLTTSNPFTLSGGTLSIVTTVQVNSTFTLAGGTLSGGTVSFAAGQTLAMTSSVNNRLTGVTVNGDLTLAADSARVKIEGGTTFTTAHLSGGGSGLGFAPGQTLTGTILFEGASQSSRSVEMNGTAGTLTIGASGALRTAAGFGALATARVGGGSIFGGTMTLINQGLISSEVSGPTLNLSAASFSNPGTIQVTAGTLALTGAWSSTGTTVVGGGTLNLGGTFSTAGLGSFNRTGGTVNITGTLNNTGATLTLNNSTGSWNLALGGATVGTVSGGTVNFADGQTLGFTNDGAMLTGVTINGDLTLATGARVRIEGGTTFANLHLSSGELSFAPGQTLTGNILFEGSAGGATRVVGMNGTGTLTIGPTGSIKTVAGMVGTGYIRTSPFPIGAMTLVNQGLISAEANNTTLVIELAANFTNTGTMAVDSGSTLRLVGTATWSNTGTLRVAGGTLELAGTLTTAAFGISSIVHTGGTVSLTGTLDNTGAALQVNNPFILNGGTLSGGTVNFAAGQTLGISNRPTNRLTGVTVNGDLTLSAVFAQVKIEGGTTFANAHLSGNSSSLGFAPGQMLTGNILFEGANNGPRAVEMNGTPGTLTIGPTGSIKIVAGFGGTGYIGGATNFGGAMTLVNQGLISAEARTLSLTTTIIGGTISTAGTGKFLLNAGTLQGVTLAGVAEVQTNSFVKGGLNLTGGQLIVNAGRKLTFQAGNQSLTGNGTMLFADTEGSLEVEANRQLTLGAGVIIVATTGTNRLIASASGASGVIDSIISTAPGATVLLVGNWTDRSTRIVPSDSADGGPITRGVPLPGKISVAGEQDNWTYFARAGQGLSIFLNPANGVSPALGFAQLQMLDPANNVIGTAAGIANGQSVQLAGFTFPADGTYTMRIQASPAQPAAVGNYLLSAYEATLDTRPLVLNQAVTGILESHYSTDRWTFSASANQQVQFHLLGAASPGIRFRLTGPNGFVGFTDLNADSGLVNLPATGEYVLQAAGNLTGFGAYTLRLDATSQTVLALGTTYNGRLSSSGFVQLFKVDVTQSTPLLMHFDDATDTDRTEVYARLGAPPTRQTFDARFDAEGADHRVAVPFAAPGAWYVLVYGDHVASASNFTLRALAPLVASLGVTPNFGGVGVQSPVTITGLGFVPGTQFDLVPVGGGATIPAQQVSIDSTTQASATFDLTGAGLGHYDVRVTLPTGPSSSLPGAFEVGALAGSQLEANLILPAVLGRRAVATLYVEYANTGTVPMAAPILVVQSGDPDNSDRPLLTLDESRVTQGFWTSAIPDGIAHSVQIYASGAAPGVLQPGERIRVPVYYVGLQVPRDLSDTRAEFELRIHSAGDTTTIDWPSLEAELRPDWITADAWPAVFANLQAQIGATWGDYVRMLSNNALYLSRLGETASSVELLYGFELQQALGLNPLLTIASAVDASAASPGLPLTFSRSFGNTITERYRVGPFGRGWNTSWQQFAETRTDGTVIVHESADAQRRFQPDSRRANTYFRQTGDTGTLRKVAGGAYELTEASGFVTRFLADGRLDLVRDTYGNTITAGYTNNRLTSLTHSNSLALGITYNAAGHIASIADPFGHLTTFGYDPTGSLLLTATDHAGTVTYTYSTGNGAAREYALTSVTDPSGVTQSFEYDTQGRLTAIFVGANVGRTNFTYDDAGAVTITDAANVFATIFFDHNRQVARVEDNTGNYVRTQFDADLRPVTQTDAEGASQSITWTSTGALRTLTDEFGHTTTFTSGGPLNQPLAFSDARGNSTRYTYNTAGDVTATTYADNSAELATYDLQGNPDVLTNRRGQTNDLTVNADGQVTHEARSDGTAVDYTYDALGRLETAADASGITTLSYDDADRLTRVEYPNGRWLQYTYDAAGRRTRLEDQTGFVVQYDYDAAGRLERLLDAADALIVRYAYDDAGRLSREDKGNGTFTEYGYDGAGRVAGITHHAPDNSITAAFGYTYDLVGRLVATATPDGAWTYAYDLTDQLIHAVFASTNPGVPSQDLTYEYDALGNRVRTVLNGATTNYTANSLNQYTAAGATTFSYDLDGNLVQETGPGGVKTYTYDLRNRLTRVQTPQGVWQYEYDVLGNRAAVIVDGQRTEYLIDPTGLGDVVGEYAGGSLVAHYTQALGLASRVDAGGAAAFYGFDAIGNTAQLTGQGGTVLNRYSYLPFGERLSAAGTTPNPFTFVGRFGVMAEDNGLDFMRARFYSPSAGRFLSQDPLRLGGGQINLYTYVSGNPLTSIDPSGLNCRENSIEEIESAIRAQERELRLYQHGNGPNDLDYTRKEKLKRVERTIDFLKEVLKLPECSKPPRCEGFPDLVNSGACPDTSPPPGPKCEDFPDFVRNGSCDPPPPPPPPPAPPTSQPTPPKTPAPQVVGARDPNEKLGASGFGPEAYIPADTLIPYRINFENLGPGSVPTPAQPATAPAQRVVVTDQLSANFDWNTLQFTEFGFGDTLVTVPDGRANHFDTVPLTYNNRTFDVQVELTFDSATGLVSAVFQSLDPGTKLPPDVLTGFLPPEDGTGIGQAHFSYTIKTKAGLATGTELRNIALIRFDDQLSIATNQVDPQNAAAGTSPDKEALNTLDAAGPASSVTSLPATTNSANFTVNWSGSDDTGGSGIAIYDVFVSDNNGPFTAFVTRSTATSATFTGTNGHTYAFFSVATDNVGHVETAPSAPDTMTTLGAANDPPVLDLIGDKSVAEGSSLSFTVTASSPNPGDMLTFSLDPGAPADAHVDPNTGIFTWTPADGPAGYALKIRVVANGNPYLDDFESFTITVDNVVPTAVLSNSGPVAEGSGSTVLFSNPFDPSAADTAAGFLYSYDFNNDGVFEIVDSSSASASVPAGLLSDGPATRAVRGRIKDKDGGFTDSTTTIIINNVAPTAGVQGPTLSVRGQPREFVLAAVDVSPIDQAAGFDFEVAWGDGSTSAVHGPSGTIFEHVFKTAGVYVIQVSATDKDQGVSEIVSHTITINAIQLQGNTLVIGGTSSDDNLRINPGGGASNIKVMLNGTTVTYAGVSRIVAFGQAGDDRMHVAGGIKIPVDLYGGDDDDDLKGGGGPSILVGGEGNDQIQGGVARNLLIGGLGTDALQGLGGDDLLIADDFLRGSRFATLQARAQEVLARWTAGDSYVNRVALLRDDVLAMIFNDDADDSLQGNGGLDWFLADLSGPFSDFIIDRALVEILTNSRR